MTTIIFILITLFALLLLEFRIEHIKHELEAKIDSQKKTIVDILDKDLELVKLYRELAMLLKEKQEVLEGKVCTLEWHVTNLNALHKVEAYPTSTDKYDPLNPSKVFYDTNTHVECNSKITPITSQQLPPEAIHFTKED